MKTWIFPSDFSICSSDTLETSFRHLGCPLFPTKIRGTVADMGKFLLGFYSQYISRKSHGSVPKITSSFGAVVRKPGLGVNYPPPTCNTRIE